MSVLLFNPTNTKLLRILRISCPLDVQSICQLLDLPPSLVRHQLWELQRFRLVLRSVSVPEEQSSLFTVDVGQLQDALALAAHEMGATDW
ncbi:hypothetical protein AL755_02835 (plasmid) [Arthrobacter sp. ERGS1:01]|uniref:hypothetical protein n=1 Tax=Arthrobacter sp. ERGS1:01 TaxID=1704044 RepID=UPI0006B5F79A|nr:hypothetical protein [Arthrobacter sp. ERGS1:01]ALE04592.1 hypothetical protein AL755_02835 [Arthrobacter sp. ERGS1:01]